MRVRIALCERHALLRRLDRAYAVASLFWPLGIRQLLLALVRRVANHADQREGVPIGVAERTGMAATGGWVQREAHPSYCTLVTTAPESSTDHAMSPRSLRMPDTLSVSAEVYAISACETWG